MKAFIIPFLFLSLTSCAKTTKDCGFNVNVYGKIIAHQNLPIIVYIDKSVPETFHKSIYKAADSINRASKILDIKVGSGHNNIYFNGYDFEPNQQAITRSYYTANYIIQSNIFVNSSFKFYNTGEIKNGFNFEALMLHELGHLIGLKHDEVDSIMNTYLASGVDRIRLTKKDEDNIKCVY